MSVFKKRLLRVSMSYIVGAFALFASVMISSPNPSSFLPVAEAQSPTAGLSGYAWSPNIGWISFDTGTNAVTLAVDGISLNGFAWSPNVGWIKFGGLSGFPAGGGTIAQDAKIQSGALTGWARACLGTANNDCTGVDDSGWDGWIALSGTGFGPTVSGSAMSGYAWGDDTVGWIDFSGVIYTANPPSCTVTNPGYDVTPSGSVTLTWTTQNTVSSSIDRGVGSVAPVAGGNISVTVPGTDGVYLYTMTATNATGAIAACNTSVSVVTPVPPPLTIDTFSIDPTRVRSGNASTLHWEISNFVANACTITGSDNSSYEVDTASGSLVTNVITRATSFTLTCTGAGSITKTVGTIPRYQEI